MAEYFQRTEEKMKRSVEKLFALSGALLTLFVLWTAAVCFIDVQPIGPDGSSVGLAALNAAFQKTLGVNMTLYEITDWLGIVPLCFVCGFALLGLVQLIKKKAFAGWIQISLSWARFTQRYSRRISRLKLFLRTFVPCLSKDGWRPRILRPPHCL